MTDLIEDDRSRGFVVLHLRCRIGGGPLIVQILRKRRMTGVIEG